MIGVNQVVRVDAPLQVGDSSQTVDVLAEAPPLQTDRSDVRKELTTRDLNNLPIGGYRSFQSLLGLGVLNLCDRTQVAINLLQVPDTGVGDVRMGIDEPG